MTDTTEAVRAQFGALADHMAGQRDAILQHWRLAAANAGDLAIASSLTRRQFNDHIPGVILAFVRTLRAAGEVSKQSLRREKEQVTEHGLQRWQQGYQLHELASEWGYLQICLMEELESYAMNHSGLEISVMPTARRALARLCWDGIAESTEQYWRLHQTEAAGNVRDLEQALATLNELERARAEAWREAAHDLKGSVTVVKGAAPILQIDDVPEPVRLQFFDRLQKGVSSLHEMLNDLMSLARLEAGHEQRVITTFDAAILLAEFCAVSLPLARERGLRLDVQGPDSLLVEGDRAKIQRILQNLLLNAIKYTPRGGVTVIWGMANGEHGKRWMFCVQDTGPGLNADSDTPLAHQLHEATQIARELDHAPAPNQLAQAPTVPAQSRTLPPGQIPGEGVGLTIVKRLCELLDASIELETSPGKGSTFRVILPRSYARQES